MEILRLLFGEGATLTPLQMGFRAFVMFFIMLVLIRIGGMRIFGKQSAFDDIVVITMGAILARGVTGSSPFFSTVGAATVLIMVHYVLATISLRSRFIEKILKGGKRKLFANGKMLENNMRISNISKRDFMESLREEANTNDITKIETAYMEMNGRISFVMKDENS